MELKPAIFTNEKKGIETFNRTNMELKLFNFQFGLALALSFNRTNMELKRFTETLSTVLFSIF